MQKGDLEKYGSCLMRYYHGTTDKLIIKDNVLKPPIDTGIIREDWREKLLDKVFLTTSLVSAKRYSRKAVEHFGGKPIIYLVQPIGYFYNNCMNEYIADEAKIIDKIEMAQGCHLFYWVIFYWVITSHDLSILPN